MSLETEEDRAAAKKLIEDLNALAETHPSRGGVRKFTNKVEGSDATLDSWKFKEWDYPSKKVTLPTYARGLFTNEDGIVCRGYDKFYSLGEYASVSEPVLRETTQGPYTVTVKSNGCIAFISGLEDGTLVVCSKHSTGNRSDVGTNHALAAQESVERQLAALGIPKEQLAKQLYDLRATAVAELCDDEFEEHVLEYKGDRAGLYLHGLNANTPRFQTYPMEQVNELARAYGFKETKFDRFENFDEMLGMMKEAAKTGCVDGEETEGFVVRCKKLGQNGGEPSDFFFKFKFAEPYLLYREMREVTKQYIQGTNPTQIKYGKHRLICMDYLHYVMPLLHDNPQLAEDYMNNKSIIELRNRYLSSKGKTGLEAIGDEFTTASLEQEMKDLEYEDQPCKYIITTVATIGCGKTTTAMTVQNLFPDKVGMVLNDNIQRPVGRKLVSQGLEQLVDKPIVILDKNNHKFFERKKIFDDFHELNTLYPDSKVKFICLNFLPNGPEGNSKLWDLTRDRVVARGDNHQSIKASNVAKAEGIMRGFIGRFQTVDPSHPPDSNFDLIIDLDVTQPNSSLQNAKTVVDKLCKFGSDLNLKRPTDQQFEKAFEEALSYKPTVYKNMGGGKGAKQQNPRYYGISVPRDLVLNATDQLVQQSPEAAQLYSRMQPMDSPDLHVTMFHRGSDKHQAKYAKVYNHTLFGDDIKTINLDNPRLRGNRYPLPSGVAADIRLDQFVCGDKLACIKVTTLKVYRPDGVPIDAPMCNKYPHITLGTLNNSVSPVESNTMLNELYEFGVRDRLAVLDFPDGTTLNGLPVYAQY